MKNIRQKSQHFGLQQELKGIYLQKWAAYVPLPKNQIKDIKSIVANKV